MRLDSRKEQLLSAAVREYCRNAEPIASGHLQSELGVSSATVRNEMAALEKAGYLRQPHTSAGRVPTEQGYRYYIDNCLEEKDVAEDVRALQKNVGSGLVPGRGGAQGTALQDTERALKNLARELAEKVREGVFVSFAARSTYYTGLTHLFEQPEFQDVDLVRQVGQIVDNLDRIITELFDEVHPGIKIYVGSENPFGDQCGTVLLRGAQAPMLGVLGPMRMDYDRTIAIMKGIGRLIEPTKYE